MRTPMRLALAALALVLAFAAAVRWTAPAQRPVTVSAVVEERGDSGDEQTTTSFDGAMVRKRAAIAIRPARGADRAHIRAELQKAAGTTVGPLTEATFAVFGEQMLTYLVPEMTFVLPEGVPVTRAEAFMRDHQPADVAFYLTQTVLVHDVTFAVVPAAGSSPAAVRDRTDAEGILADALNHYVTTVQPAGVTVRYFGGVLSDATIGAVRAAMGRAAGVPAERVQVSANLPGPGVELDNGPPDLSEAPHGHH